MSSFDVQGGPLTIGISTYALFWHISDRASRPYTAADVLHAAADFGVDVVQMCDYPPIEMMDHSELDGLYTTANRLGLRIELGTRGIQPEHLRRYLSISRALDSGIVRTMLQPADRRNTEREATAIFAEVLPQFEAADVTIALETYEQVPTPTTVRLVESVNSARLGICSDPSNTIAILENPDQVIDWVAPYVRNMHVKDFAFTREPGSIGFHLTGAALGTGLLDYDRMADAIRPAERGISQIIEHWLPWQGDEETTLAVEDDWTRTAVEFLRSRSAIPAS